MNQNFRAFSVVTIIILLSSCASTYKSIHPESLNYPTARSDSGFSYRHNVLKESRNRKLAKKEDKRQIRIIAVKIVNNSGAPMKYLSNYRIYSMDREVRVLDPQTAVMAVKQTVPTYLLYLLFTPLRFTVENQNGISVTPVGLVLGPVLAGGNMAVAATANKRFRQELEASSIIDREIKHGETFYGLLPIHDNQFMPLNLVMNK